jgi:UDP-N-acetylglucosamine--N-acetylmuramyl-(pentapeptide) pyrophosphoryl-undecaprenol N-acetylglucosamine transferase
MDLKLANVEGYKQFEYISDELPHIFAMADVIVSRAGATTLFELLALKKPNLLIPLSVNASRGDQILNSKSFEKQGYSRMLMEEKLNADSFAESLNEVYTNRQSYIKAMSSSTSGNGIDKIVKIIVENTK